MSSRQSRLERLKTKIDNTTRVNKEDADAEHRMMASHTGSRIRRGVFQDSNGHFKTDTRDIIHSKQNYLIDEDQLIDQDNNNDDDDDDDNEEEGGDGEDGGDGDNNNNDNDINETNNQHVHEKDDGNDDSGQVDDDNIASDSDATIHKQQGKLTINNSSPKKKFVPLQNSSKASIGNHNIGNSTMSSQFAALCNTQIDSSKYNSTNTNGKRDLFLTPNSHSHSHSHSHLHNKLTYNPPSYPSNLRHNNINDKNQFSDENDGDTEDNDNTRYDNNSYNDFVLLNPSNNNNNNNNNNQSDQIGFTNDISNQAAVAQLQNKLRHQQETKSHKKYHSQQHYGVNASNDNITAKLLKDYKAELAPIQQILSRSGPHTNNHNRHQQ
jgi:hypothetical protein